MTVNALTAANAVVIPIQCEYLALEGLMQLVNTIDLVRRRLNPALDVLGVVMTMFDARTRLSPQVVQDVRRFFPSRSAPHGHTAHGAPGRSAELRADDLRVRSFLSRRGGLWRDWARRSPGESGSRHPAVPRRSRLGPRVEGDAMRPPVSVRRRFDDTSAQPGVAFGCLPHRFDFAIAPTAQSGSATSG